MITKLFGLSFSSKRSRLRTKNFESMESYRMTNNALVFAHSGKGGLQAARFLLLFPANQPRNTAAQHRGIHSKESHDKYRFPATTRGKWKQVFIQKRRLRPLTEDPPAVTESRIDFAGRTNPISLGYPTLLGSSFRHLEDLRHVACKTP